MAALIRFFTALIFSTLAFNNLAWADLENIKTMEHDWVIAVDKEAGSCYASRVYPNKNVLGIFYSTKGGVHLLFSGLQLQKNESYTVHFVFSGGKEADLKGTAATEHTLLFQNLNNSTQDLFAYSDIMIVPQIGDYNLEGAMQAMTAAMDCMTTYFFEK